MMSVRGICHWVRCHPMLGQGVAATEGKQGEQHGGYNEEQGGGGGGGMGDGRRERGRVFPGERHLSQFPLLFPHPRHSESIFIKTSLKRFSDSTTTLQFRIDCDKTCFS